MNKRIIGALLLLGLGVVAILGIWLALPHILSKQQRLTSDAAKTRGKITVALDNWIGYFPIRSPEMAVHMRRLGWNLVCEDDKADYPGRMKRLANDEIDMAVATVDSYVLNGAGFNFPGTMIFVIDESKGGDSIVANKSKVPNLDALKKSPGIRVAFTPNSPSHHLAKATADHFGIPQILPKGANRIETNGSSEALKDLSKGKADVAILWEPDVSRAVADGRFVKLLGTEDTEKLIVDILIVSRKFAAKNPEVVSAFISGYFQVLKQYRDSPEKLAQDVKKDTGLSAEAVASMLKGVMWPSLTENCEKWFGVSQKGSVTEQGIIDTITSTVRILINAGDFKTDPIPESDPYRLINSTFLAEASKKSVAGFTTPGVKAGTAAAVDSIAAPFKELNESGWKALREVGRLRVEPIVFQSGVSEMDLFAQQAVDANTEKLKHYPNFRVVIEGHTGAAGDPGENQKLSQDRADAVGRYLQLTYNIDPNRLRIIGYGGTKPLPREADESDRSYDYRLPRVDFVLVREEI
jgi:outer membrane protein OmpA-like peptidoglycan-associated protein/ABC-type taurine transport system substrate-binding protein